MSHRGQRLSFHVSLSLKPQQMGFSLVGFFFFGGNWKHYCGDASSSSPTSFLHLHYYALYRKFSCFQLDKRGKRFPGIKNHWCIFKMTFAVFNSTFFGVLLYVGIMCTCFHGISVAKLWIFYTSSKQLWEGRSNWSRVVWQETLSCLRLIIPNSNSGISPWSVSWAPGQ